MASYDKILTDPYNPINIVDGFARFPNWLGGKVVCLADLPEIKNTSVLDQIISIHASYYDATRWYPWLGDFTPESIFMTLEADEINHLIYDHVFPEEKKQLVVDYLNRGFNFVKSSKKFSHRMARVNTFEDFMEEITHPDVIMSFKNGCREVFFRKFIDGIESEYRIYIYQGKIRYIEEYINHGVPLNVEAARDRRTDVINYVEKVMPRIEYKDYLLDICISSTIGFSIIEINTPFYLFGGIYLGNYEHESDSIHNASEGIFRWQNNDTIHQLP